MTDRYIDKIKALDPAGRMPPVDASVREATRRRVLSMAPSHEDRRARPLRTAVPKRRHLVLTGALVVIALAVVSLSGVFGDGGPLTIDKALAAVTAAEGEVLHIKITGLDTDGSPFMQENWSCAGSDWKYRGRAEAGGQKVWEVALAAGGLHQIYDVETNSLLEAQDETVAGLAKSKGPAYDDMIRELLTSGRAQEDGREQVDGRDAVRIVEKRPAADGKSSENVFLVDAETGDPIEFRIMNEDENRTLHFDIYEKLPGTSENLRLLNLKAAYPGATVYTDPAEFEQAVAGAPAATR